MDDSGWDNIVDASLEEVAHLLCFIFHVTWLLSMAILATFICARSNPHKKLDERRNSLERPNSERLLKTKEGNSAEDERRHNKRGKYNAPEDHPDAKDSIRVRKESLSYSQASRKKNMLVKRPRENELPPYGRVDDATQNSDSSSTLVLNIPLGLAKTKPKDERNNLRGHESDESKKHSSDKARVTFAKQLAQTSMTQKHENKKVRTFILS
ncbi:hypothetical protein WR25_20911 [Diploscapter pachys]|uniref:Uncharacterized protein n=1 Tax=Diploscapter pachys TaxID=2018661 RepID=A0A2A2JDS9_9BILA|nr:hypothetical protein WR25_20911 [Diploscapter pachys]